MENVTFAWTGFGMEEFPDEVATACVESMELWAGLNYIVQKFTNKYPRCHAFSKRAIPSRNRRGNDRCQHFVQVNASQFNYIMSSAIDGQSPDFLMQTSYSAKPVTLSIAAVERDTGLSKDTLRVWERRYGFPMPERDTLGERSYPFGQVERLRTIKRLLDAGHRPGRVVLMTPEDLERLASTVGLPAVSRELPAEAQAPTDLSGFMQAIGSNDVEGLRRLLARSLSRVGLGHFVLDVVAPLNVQVGEMWMQGRIEVFQEHVYTESVQVVLRNALHHLPPAGAGRPRVLLATVTGEPHGLGLLMAEAVLALEGCRCVSLGVQTPVWDIVRAAIALDVEVVALSYTGCTNPNNVIDGLVELRSKLPPSIELWAGGSAPVLQRRAIEGLRVIPALQQVAAALTDWHQRHPDAI